MRGLGPWVVLRLFVAGCLVVPDGAFAQNGPAPAFEAAVGYAGFADDATIAHALVGGTARWPVTPRLSVGPEITYMRGPRADRDLVVTGNVTWDLVSGAGSRPGPAAPRLPAVRSE